jgi:hypothetical protein
MKYLETKEIAEKIKIELGYNRKKVSVKKGSSIRYVTVKILDESVNISKLKDFCKNIDTWSMSIDDYCDGQSIEVRISDEVRKYISIPYFEFVSNLELPQEGEGVEVMEGVLFWNANNRVFFNEKESPYLTPARGIFKDYFLRKEADSLRHLAFELGMLLKSKSEQLQAS